MSSSILSQKALAIPSDVRQSYLLGISEIQLHSQICRLLENMESEARCEITHGRDEYGRDIVLRRSSPFGHEYIAIVVKRGDKRGKITGRTAREVDEVISQVKQSVAHLCYLKVIDISPVNIKGVWVLFFGNLTDGAVKRILAEAPPLSFKPFAIGWLADAFAKHYPEIFFAGAASTYLQDKVIEFETQHDLSRRPQNLSDWYVNPSVAITQIDASTFSERLKKALKLRRLTYQQFRNQLDSQRYFVLSAGPGLGKTTMLRKLALDLYRDALTRTASLGTDITPGALRIPILVTATEMANYEDLDSFTRAQLPPEDIRDSFTVSCLLVDALDELPQEKQAATLKFAYQIAKSLECSMIVSARPVHVVRDLADEESLRLPVVQLMPFQYNQAMNLIDRLVQDPEIVKILREGIASLRSHMVLSPLSVSLLLDIAEAEREIPGTIGEIFEQYMDIALGRYDVERGIEVVFQFFIKKQLLSELAWFEFFEKGRLKIGEDEFDRFLADYFDTRRFDKDMIPRMKADIDRSGVIRFSDGVYFAHRAFLDFFVALYITGHSDEFCNISKWIAKIYFSDKWSEVGFYFFAQRREIFPDFIDNVIELDKDDSVDYHLRRFMVGRLIQAAWLSPSENKKRAIKAGVSSAPKLLEIVSRDVEKDAPQSIPYGVMAGLAELSYSSRTLHQEVSEVVVHLTESDSIDDYRSAINLLWANRTRIPSTEAGAQADLVLDQMARLEKLGKLLLVDKTLGYFLLETVVEDDKIRHRAINRRIRRLLKAQPRTIRKMLTG